MNSLSSHTPTLDKIAVSTSALCALHCLSLPLLIGVFPALGLTIFGQESFRTGLLRLVVPLSMLAMTLGCRKHKDIATAAIGGVGLACMIFAGLAGHDLLGEQGERTATLIGACAIAAAHIRNYMLCRHADCQH